MTRNTKNVAFVAIGAVVLIVLVFVIRDLYLRDGIVKCGDGPRQRIDVRDFNTKYWAYSVEFEASVADKAKLSGKLNPVQLQQLSESMQSANEFRKYVVNGYNSCAISGAQYDQYGARFQALDGLSREIDSLSKKPHLSQEEQARLGDLTKQYIQLARKLGE